MYNFNIYNYIFSINILKKKYYDIIKMSEEVFDEKALESETAIRDAGEVKVQEKAVSEATNEI